MALTPTIKSSLVGAMVVGPALSSETMAADAGAMVPVNLVSSQLAASLAGAMTVGNFPTPFLWASDVGAIVTTNFLAREIQVAMVGAMVVARGRIDNPKLRAWTFSLDGHDFYVLRLGDEDTLVYDTYSEQWMDWVSPNYTFWRPNCGINWVGGQNFAGVYGSNVVVGDDVHGLIYFLNPEQPYDESPLPEAVPQEQYFERILMGQVPMRGREVLPCYAVWLTTDMGNPAYDGAGVTLYTSDDAGDSFDDHGLVTVTLGDRNPELSWYSLGQIEAPGRLFKLVEYGAVKRIDDFQMNDPDDEK